MHSIRAVTHADLARRVDSLTRAWGAPVIARRGQLIDTAVLPALVATTPGSEPEEWLGLLTYALRDDGLEVVSVHVEAEGRGVGRALMDAARQRALEAGATRLWLSTTNDNARAIRFYQQWGMDLVAVLFDEVARSRLVKPIIPVLGDHGIPIRHELEFELLLG